MGKKRGFANSSAQITLFMILGIVLLFITIFFIMLTTSLQKDQLKEEQEKVFTAAFYKEGLRLFVEDALKDELSAGLLLMGKQGRIWKEQGGVLECVSDVNCITLPDEDPALGGRVFIGIQEPETTQYPESYPCVTNKEDFPAFCTYSYPNTAQFGSRRYALTKRTVENDLESFLVSEVKSEVESFIHDKVSRDAAITSGDIVINVELLNGGIAVSVEYPLYVTSGTSDFFTLSEFDFFYDTDFTKFVTKAILNPLRWDWSSVDFEYTPDTLNANSFTYRSENGESEIALSLFPELDIQMETYTLDDGTDIFTFTYPLEGIIQTDPGETIPEENYLFRIARENRPPALDYINRCPGTDVHGNPYDYLVIENDASLGDVKIKMEANDPDEDILNIFEIGGEGILVEDSFTLSLDELRLAQTLNPITDNIFETIALVSDGLAQDSQTVRIKVGGPEESICCAADPNDNTKGNAVNPNEICFVSKDPVQGCFSNTPEIPPGYLLQNKQFTIQCGTGGSCNGV
ncbi:hypothetical protein COV17_01470, partial [Candidatus Woesearchaeota archaeon CG10_big_fil_rev_8_21_14_0_10_36_11]